jgi:hypothetical protein
MTETKPQMIFKQMTAVMKEIKSITKDQKNVAQGFKFRGIDQFVNALYPALTKHNVFMVPACERESHELKDVTRSSGKAGIDKHVTLMMSYTFFAEDGSWIKAGPIPAEGLDSGDKATNKALSAALKYALIQTFSIPTEDMAEADLDTPEIGVASQQVVVTNSPVLTDASTNTGTTQATAQPIPTKISTFRKPKSVSTETTKTGSNGWE